MPDRLQVFLNDGPFCPTCQADMLSMDVRANGSCKVEFNCGTTQTVREGAESGWTLDTLTETTTCLRAKIKRLEGELEGNSKPMQEAS